MGKILIIKNSDFSSVSVEKVTFGPEEIWDDLTQNVIYSDKKSQFLHYPMDKGFINCYQIRDYLTSNMFIVDISSYEGGKLKFTHRTLEKSTNYDPPAYWACFASDVITTDLTSTKDSINNFATVVSYIEGTLNTDDEITSITEILQIPLGTKYLVSLYNSTYDFKIECKK